MRQELRGCDCPYIHLTELWAAFNPLGFSQGLFMLFRGYIDENYNDNQCIFALSAVTSYGKYWRQLERAWKLVLADTNRKRKKAGLPKISRYHAADCSSCHGEFEGWSHSERDAFVLELFRIFHRVPLHIVALDMNLDELCEVFPEWSRDRLRAAYFLLTGVLLNTIGKDYAEMSGNHPVKIVLFHDQTGKYDPTILRAFNRTMLETDFPYKDYFVTIAPLKWQDCIALQPADLVAFEFMKDAEARRDKRKVRRSLKALLKMDSFGRHSMTLSKKGMLEIRKAYVASGMDITTVIRC